MSRPDHLYPTLSAFVPFGIVLGYTLLGLQIEIMPPKMCITNIMEHLGTIDVFIPIFCQQFPEMKLSTPTTKKYVFVKLYNE